MTGFQELLLTPSDRCAISEACLDQTEADRHLEKQIFDDLFHTYSEQLSQLDLEYSEGGDRWPFAARSHDQIHTTITTLRNAGLSITRAEARKAVKGHFNLIVPDGASLDSLIDAALRIWLLINFRPIINGSIGYGRPCVAWLENEKLETCLEDVFQSSTTKLTLAQRRLSPQFTAVNMKKICGLKIRWAATLDDHLNLDREHKLLWIFPFRAWLHLHSKRKDSKTNKSSAPSDNATTSMPLHPAVYEEAERTLDLLFPSWDRNTQKFLRKQGKEQMAWYAQNRELDLKYYRIWRDRLLDLNEVIYQAPPEGWAQLWNDRRDPQRFWTFWIALVILWLTIVATVAAVVQTWATLKPSPNT